MASTSFSRLVRGVEVHKLAPTHQLPLEVSGKHQESVCMSELDLSRPFRFIMRFSLLQDSHFAAKICVRHVCWCHSDQPAWCKPQWPWANPDQTFCIAPYHWLLTVTELLRSFFFSFCCVWERDFAWKGDGSWRGRKKGESRVTGQMDWTGLRGSEWQRASWVNITCVCVCVLLSEHNWGVFHSDMINNQLNTEHKKDKVLSRTANFLLTLGSVLHALLSAI